MENHSTSSLYLDLGTKNYQGALTIQREIHELRCRDKIPDTFIFIEHEPVYTIGRSSKPENFPGLNPILVERGGDVTYHGPGQLVVYPIVRVFNPGESPDLRKFVIWVEDIISDALKELGFQLHGGSEPGIWASNSASGDKKIASVGMKVKDGVSFHGVSINYGGDVLDGFMKIRPCGLDPSEMGYLGVEKDRLKDSIQNKLKEKYGKIVEVDIEYFKGKI